MIPGYENDISLNIVELISHSIVLYYVFTPVFLINLYGAPLAQRVSYLALHSSLFGPVAQLIMIISDLGSITKIQLQLYFQL